MQKIERDQFNLLILTNIFFVFTIGIFAPIEIYITNIQEFWFSILDFLWIILLSSIIAFLIILLLGLLLKGKLQSFLTCILFGITLGLYIQGNFININYGILDGKAINWDNYFSFSILNTSVWILCVILPFILYFLKFNLWKPILKFGSLFFISIQIVTLCILLITTDLNNKSDFYLSDEWLNSVSSQENIIIFILDTFDDNFFKEILSKEPDFLQALDGFTYYNNNTGMYPTTKGALPYLLTGQTYLNEQPYLNYIDQAYKNTDYYSLLKQAGFNVGIYTNDLFVSGEYCQIFIDNLEKSRPKVSSHLSLQKELYKLSAFRYFPHITKKYFWLQGDEFEVLKSSNSTEKSVFVLDNLNYYDKLNDEKLAIIDDKCYRFIHLYGVHPPYNINLNEQLQIELNDNATYYSQSKAVLKIIYEYINQLKNLNAYDQSLIIITADHGATGYNLLTNPFLLIKDKKSIGMLSVSDVPVSHADLQGTVMQSLGMNLNNKYGFSILDNSINLNRERTFLYYNWDDSWNSNYLPDIREYKINPETNDYSSFYFTQRVYTSNGVLVQEIPKYILGNELSFLDDNPSANRYIIYGFSENEKTHTWNAGKNATMAFKFDSPTNDLMVSMDINYIFNGPQHFIAKVGNITLYDQLISEPQLIEFIVPNELIIQNVLDIKFEFPDAISPSLLGKSDDPRNLAFAFTSMKIEEAD